jgi:hypothetical protein
VVRQKVGVSSFHAFQVFVVGPIACVIDREQTMIESVILVSAIAFVTALFPELDDVPN